MLKYDFDNHILTLKKIKFNVSWILNVLIGGAVICLVLLTIYQHQTLINQQNLNVQLVKTQAMLTEKINNLSNEIYLLNVDLYVQKDTINNLQNHSDNK